MSFFLISAFVLIVVGRLLLRKKLNKLHNAYYSCANERGCAERYESLVRLYNSRDPRVLESAYREAISCTKVA